MRHALWAAALFATLAVFHTWPLASAPARRSLNHNADAELNAWIVSWIPHALVTGPAHLFDADIFAPERNTLAYSEPLIVPALVGAPIRWLGGSPVLTFNLLLLTGLVLTAWSAWFVTWKWTGSVTAAMVSGALAAFNVHLLTRLPHLQAAHAWGVPLTLYFADRLVDRPNRRDAATLALVVAATAATSIYWLALAGLIVACVALTSGLRSRALVAMSVAALVGVGLAAPVLLPYVRLAAGGATRPIELVAQFAATPAGYLVSTSRVDASWGARLFTSDVNVFFAGGGALLLAVLGLGTSAAAGGADRRRAILLVALAIAGVVLSLGPATAIYRALYAWVPPVRGLRVAARFGYLYLLAIAIAAGWGVAWLERRIRSRQAAVACAAVIVVTAEVWQGPIRTTPFAGTPAIYSILAESTAPVLLVEVPFYPPDAVFQNGEYVLNATAHWQPLMNGYSGYTPDSYRRRAAAFWFFPEDWAIRAIEHEGATHVMVHLDRFGTDASTVGRTLDGRPDLRLLAADRDGIRLYAIER
jgi:hypothetical protein